MSFAPPCATVVLEKTSGFQSRSGQQIRELAEHLQGFIRSLKTHLCGLYGLGLGSSFGLALGYLGRCLASLLALAEVLAFDFAGNLG
jgi:hypothetical protein